MKRVTLHHSFSIATHLTVESVRIINYETMHCAHTSNEIKMGRHGQDRLDLLTGR